MDWRQPCALNTRVANLVGSCSEVETWAWSMAIRNGKMTGPFEAFFSWWPAWPFWSLSLRYRVSTVWRGKICWRSDVSTANGNWLVGQLLPHYVTSSHSHLCCSVWCSMCSRPSPSHTQAFGKVPISLQEHKCSKVAWFLPNRTFNSHQDSCKVVWFVQSIQFYTNLSASGHCCSAVTQWNQWTSWCVLSLRPERLRR